MGTWAFPDESWAKASFTVSMARRMDTARRASAWEMTRSFMVQPAGC
jgi:hypothetical protein